MITVFNTEKPQIEVEENMTDNTAIRSRRKDGKRKSERKYFIMRNIVLVCNMGMSTSLMVNKMRAAAKEQGYECEVNAYALQKAEKEIAAADIILVGPQIAFEMPKIKAKFPDKTVEAIAMQDYGRMDGAKVLARVKEVLGD